MPEPRAAANGAGTPPEPRPTPPLTQPGPHGEPVVDLRGRGTFDAGGSPPPARPRREPPPTESEPDAPPEPQEPAGLDGTDTPAPPIDPWRSVDEVWSPAEGWHSSGGTGAAASPGHAPTDHAPTDHGPPDHGPPVEAELVEPRRPPGSPVHPGSLTRRLVWALVPAVVVVLCATIVAIAAVARAGSMDHIADELASAAADQRVAGSAVDLLWSDALGVVAAGVGQEVATPGEVLAGVGEVRGADAARFLDPGLDVDERTGQAVTRASRARGSFAREVEQLVEASRGDPIELGNELAELSERHEAARDATDRAATRLDDAADRARRDAGRLHLAAVAALVLGLLGGAFALLRARRRFRDGVDLPVARLHDAVRRIGAGEAGVRSRAGGLPELSALGTELDSVVRGLGDQLDDLRRRAEWSHQSRLIFDALDLADDEDALFDVVSRAFAVVDPARPVELLLTDRGPSRLTVVATNPHLEPPGTPVDSAGACVALRRGQVAVFESSGSINSCPMLRQRPGGDAESGACIPVTVAGRPAGVIHMTGPELHPPEPHVVERLVSLASQVGNRLGALRTLESTRYQASTDGLTGLPNRRSLEAGVAALLESGTPFVMVIADLDKFKRLNDTYGHEIGDKALQLFAGVLRDNVRGNDLVARLGGEEFVLVYPNMSVEISIEAIGRLRAALARAVAQSPLPSFTCSFGVTHSSVGEDGDSILRIADAGLLRAKELGGDQAVFADAELAAAVFADRPDDPGPPSGPPPPPPSPPAPA